jgi:hypothetical protein
MANIITAGNSSNGGTAISTDTSGTLNIVTGSGSGVTAMSIDASQNVAMTASQTVAGNLTVTGSITGGSISTSNSLRAWVNFNGTGTVAIRASFNVTSITDNGTGDYTVNFTNAMTDANYAVVTSGQFDQTNTSSSAAVFSVIARYSTALSTSSTRITYSAGASASNADGTTLCVSVFR